MWENVKGQTPGWNSLVAQKPLALGATGPSDRAPSIAFGDLARDAAELAQRENWRIEELHTEEGKLDEVFRGITISETKGAEKV